MLKNCNEFFEEVVSIFGKLLQILIELVVLKDKSQVISLGKKLPKATSIQTLELVV